MLDVSAAKQVVHTGKLTQTTRLLVCLAVGSEPRSVQDIRSVGAKLGIAGIKNWNISQLLSNSDGALRTPLGWELSPAGIKSVTALAGPLASAPVAAAIGLRNHLDKVKNPDTRDFVAHAITCFEFKEYRAAVVLAWVGAMALLYDHVVSHALVAFNAEAIRRDSKWKPAKTTDDLALMGEFDFLQVLHAISIIGKNVKQELEPRLKLRNGCGHPNSLQIAEHVVASHLEILTLNVFAKF